MLENIGAMFEAHSAMTGKLKKAMYKKNMYDFRVNFGEDIQEMLDYVSSAENSEEAAAEVGMRFSDKVFELFSKNGKMKGSKKADLSFFMIYYIFPAVLLAGDESSTLLCDKLKEAWNAKFGEKISYTDYDTIYAGFKEKIFGIF